MLTNTTYRTLISPSWDCLQPSSQRIPVSHIMPASRSVHMYPQGVLLSSSMFSQISRSKAVSTPHRHLSLINGFSTYIRRSVSPQELQHPCEWPTFRPVSACRPSVQLHTDLSSWRLCFSASGSQLGPHLRPECVCFVSSLFSP